MPDKIIPWDMAATHITNVSKSEPADCAGIFALCVSRGIAGVVLRDVGRISPESQTAIAIPLPWAGDGHALRKAVSHAALVRHAATAKRKPMWLRWCDLSYENKNKVVVRYGYANRENYMYKIVGKRVGRARIPQEMD